MEDFLKIIKNFQSVGDSQLKIGIDTLEVTFWFSLVLADLILKNFPNYSFQEYITSGIFRVPSYVSLPEDQEIQEAIQKYSKEEDDKLDKQLDELKASINQVVVF